MSDALTFDITRDLALQFALILSSGVPQLDAIGYMRPDIEVTTYRNELKRWMASPLVQQAILKVQGKAWQDMDLGERIKFAVDKNYTEMAYYLYQHNYGELEGPAKVKADTCRAALETKLAGLAGKMDALTRFWDDVSKGIVNVGVVAKNAPTPTTLTSQIGKA